MGTTAWLERQLKPSSIPDTAMAAYLKPFDTLGVTPAELRAMNEERRKQDYWYAHDQLESAAIARAAWSERLRGVLQDIARLIKGKLGLSIATLDVGGWDMHTNEGRIDNGDMKNHMTELDAALGAFIADLGPAFANVTILTLTEFGRTVSENGAVGTDHGHAFPMLVLGGGIKGGQLYGAWPGLDDKNLFVNGSLAARTDYRDVLGEVPAKRGKVGSFTKIFPDHKPKPFGLANAR